MAERTFAMPDLGEGLEEGEIVSWLVGPGDRVELNQPLVEVETAKATVEISSPFAGVVVSLHGDVGASVPVGDVLATFDVASDAGGGETGSPAVPVAATPAVRTLARSLGVALDGVEGTGPGGRVTADDLRAAAGSAGRAGDAGVGFDVEPITIARRTIAERLTTSVREVPHVTTFRTLDATVLAEVRGELGLSPLPLFVKTVGETCRSHPVLHSSWHGDLGEIHVPHACHVGVATDTERGLTVPVVHGVWDLTVAEVASEIRRLAEAARGGSLNPSDLTGATISVSNTGSYGSEAGTPIIDLGHGAVIALGVIQPRALVVEGEVRARPACTISLSFDHRLMDGAAAGRALTDLVALLLDGERLRSLA
jgi:pyruvate dehydrogenase E2 component (dihydrolipoamide acetyltransferase)